MNYLAASFGLLVTFFSQANEGIDINKLKDSAINEIRRVHPKTIKSEFAFVHIGVETKSKKLDQSYIELTLADKKPLHSDDKSKFLYSIYRASFNMVSGELESVIEITLDSFQDIDNYVIK